MKSSPVGLASSVQSRSRWSRLVVAFAALAAVTSVWAQSLAFTTLAGTPGVSAPFSNNPPVTFNNPYGIAVDSAGSTYIADTGNHVVRRITAAGVISTLAGIPGNFGTTDDPTAARFNSPQGLALNSAGDRLYVADTGNHSIRLITLSGIGGTVVTVSTIAGQPGAAGNSNTGNGQFSTPRGIAADSAGNLYVADTGNHLIRKVVPTSTTASTVTTVAGLAGTTTFANGDNTTATFNAPYGVAVNAAGDTLYVADFGNHLIRRIALTTPVAVTTFAGTVGTAGFTDANGTAAQFRTPTGVSVAATGEVMVSDFGNSAVRQIAQSVGNPVTTVAGSAATSTATAGQTGYANGTGTAVRFTFPIGIATKTVAGVNFVYVADTSNHVIRQGAIPSAPSVAAATPATQTATIGATGITFTSTVTGGWPTPTLQWQIQPGGVGTFQNLTASNTYQNVNTSTLTINNITAGMNNDKFKLVATTSVAVEGTPGTLVVNQTPTFASGSVSFTAVVNRNNSFIVAASGSAPITYSGSLGTFTVFPNGTITGFPTSTAESISGVVTATNSVGSASQFITINVVPETSAAAPVITSATATSFVVGQSNNFTFTASGAPTPIIGLSGALPAGVTFVNGLLSGSPLTADGSPFNLTVSASNSVGTVTQPFTLTVTAAASTPTFITQPQNAIGNLGGTVTFTASVTGSPTPTLRWQRQAAGSSGGFADLSDDVTYTGTTTTTLTVRNLEAGMSGDQFRLVATNATQAVGSSIATLTVNVGTVISTFAGQAGLSGSTDAIGAAARFNTPAGIAVDAAGNFYIADAGNNTIRKITGGGVVTTFAGLAGVAGSTDGAATDARFRAPSAVAVSPVGTVYVADTFNQTIRAISPTGVVTTLAGLANSAGAVDGIGAVARFQFPSGVAVDQSGSVYVADSGNHTIRKVLSDGSTSTLAGAAGIAGTADSTIGTAARFNYPGNLAIDTTGNLYVADTLNHTIRRVNTVTGAVVTFAGTAGVAGALDATGTAATFNRPTGVAVDTSGNVYVADTYNNLIRRIASSGVVTTLAGSVGQAGSDDGAGGLARFNQPFALTLDANGNIFIADTRNNTIRRSGTVSAPAITTQPQGRAVPIGGNATFTVIATGTPTPSYQWQRQPAGTSGFFNLSNGGSYSGVNTATLTVSGVLSSMTGDQFRVAVANGVSPSTLSDSATLTVGEAPAFTNATTTTVRATEPLAFTFIATGSPTPTFTATGLPSWATLSTAGLLSGTPPVGSEGTITLTVTANNGVSTNQTFTLTVLPALPTISVQPASQTVDQGQSVTFSVTASGAAPLTYQWRRNVVAITGATASSLTLTNVQAANGGVYSVTVTNASGSVTSNGATLTVNTVPTFTSQPRSQVALAGSTVTLSVTPAGGTSFNYQWRKNGVAIAGATNSTLTLTAVTTADAGNYDVVVSNSVGLVISSLAQVSVVSSPAAPVIVAQPASRAALVGTSTVLSVSATGAPSPGFQWRKNGVAISGATNPTLAFTSVQAGDAAVYDVVITNSAGSVTSLPVGLRVFTRSYAGFYFGTFANGLGTFALYVRDDNTGVFLGYLPGATAPVVSTSIIVNDAGQFAFTQGAIASAAAATDGEPPRAAALAAVTVIGNIGTDGSLNGSITGGANATLAGTRAADVGATQGVAGFYQAGAATGATTVSTIAGPNGQAFVLVQSATTADGGVGTVSATGQVSVTANRSVVSETIAPGTGTVTGTSSGAISANFSGASDAVLARQRLVNISSRARVATGDAVAIAGFVISGEESKPVLIRAVGPTLGTAPFNVSGVLASPRLELFRGSTSLAVNAGIAANRGPIDAASAAAGAFALGASGADSAILTTLAPGNYTAIVSSTTNTAGVALIEVYDLSAATPGQKLLNIATRAAAGAGDNTLIAGFVIPPGSSKRVLVRGVGPGLTPFGVTGVLAQPTLLLLSGSTTIAQNTNWNTSVDAAAITLASAQVGAFGMANNDSALIVTLAPGNYTAQVLGAGGSSGVALIEVYDLP